MSQASWAEINSAAQIDRIAPRQRPRQSAIGYHTWSNLLFVHWRIPADELRPLIPPQLTLDTWEGDAWVGLVPFGMSGTRPWWAPAIPGISNFRETNVRTYVHFRGRDPGVWFFSLEASTSLAVRIARWRWHLPYFRADMSLERTDDTLLYSSRRLWPGVAGPGCKISASLEPLPNNRPMMHEPAGTFDEFEYGAARPGTLEYFLIERYVLYSCSPPGRLFAGRVHHRPYRLRRVDQLEIEENLVQAAGISRPRKPPCHAIFSEGVSVEVFPLRKIDA